ncbi:C3a anaphylatoxin chemotactic receptor [Chelonia mydas]|uniref:C3a anaphylatoxin chemotactic receptor n=1 Tax=Chelonia mydas TaxID=8469 RepID=UPI0018A2032A|nr:C3a anaphylatoxin chemotactic receptor [Chelonia mydas]
MLFFLVLFVVMCAMAFLAGVLSNGYVLFITGCRVERMASAVWFWNRAMTDFIFIVFLPFRYISIFILDLDWAKSLSNTVSSFHMFSSAFLLTALSVDRCILVARPEWAWNHRTPQLAFIMVLGLGALSLGFSLRYGYLLEFLFSRSRTSMNFHPDEGRVKAAVTIQFLVGFLIPLALILIPTFYIVLAAKMRRNRLIQSTKPLKILFGLIPAFFLCWLPYHVFSFLLILAKHRLLILDMGSAFACVLTYVNSCLNPVIYLTMEEGFLRYRQCGRNSQTTDNLGPELAE